MGESIAPIFDIAIIGAGPTGLFAAYYAGLRRMKVLVVDSLEVLGGQLTTLYPEKYIYDVAGFPRVLAKELVHGLVAQAMQYHPTVRLGEQVLSLEEHREEPGDGERGATRDAESVGRVVFSLRTSREVYEARSVLVAAGIGAFRPKKLPLKEAGRYEGVGLHYFVHDPAQFSGKRLLIAGGGDSAVDWANTLAGHTAVQTLVHRRDGFRAHEDSVKQMMGGPTKVLVFHELKAIGGEGRVESATVVDNRTGAERTLAVEAVLVNFGFESSLGPIREWGLELDGSAIRVDSTMRTSRAGLFAAGDVASYPGKLKLLATGFGEAATAVNHAKAWMDPTARVYPGHSSEMAAP